MRRLLRAFVACLLGLTLVVGLLPGRHACALAASVEVAQDGGEDADPHACCKGREGAELVAAQAAMPALEPAPDLTQDDRCTGTCCASASQAIPSAQPPVPLPSPAAVALVPPDAPALTPISPRAMLAVLGPRGPPPDPPKARLHLRNCVLRN